MTIRVVEIENLAEANRELTALGAEKKGVELMMPKALFRCLKLKDIKPAAANIIKQEMLSLGGEAANAYGAVNCSAKTTEVLIFGTVKQLQRLVEKLKLHQFNLPQTAKEIENALNNYDAIPSPLKIGRKTFDFGQRTYIMGILNLTPDSFSDGGKFLDPNSAVEHAKQLAQDGADVIDIGGESTRPGAGQISAEEEKKRVIPVIEKLAKEIDIPLSIDTTKATVAAAALAAGAVMINDISGLRFDGGLAKIAAEFQAPVVIMHTQGKPAAMQENPHYRDLMGEIIAYLEEGLAIAQRAGILSEKIIVDPGIGFGKTVDHNLEILKRIRELKVLGRPILIGASRKSFIGLPVEERLEGTTAAAAVSIANGADFIRVHDVKQMKKVAALTDAVVRGKRNYG